jgi:phenylalanyl-tRNA synthetase alpha chain
MEVLSIAAVNELAARFAEESASAEKEVQAELKRTWLSKDGLIKQLFSQLRGVSAEERPQIASLCNDLKQRVEGHFAALEEKQAREVRLKALAKEGFDLSLPAFTPGFGMLHPITIVEQRVAAVLQQLGFVAIDGPVVETEYYCFDALNIPKHHPARDMQDTFYTDHDHVLRTHTTSMQSRVLERGELPVRAMASGGVYRNEAEDASHTAYFHQFDLVWVEEGLTLSHLMGVMQLVLRELYGKRRKIRFVPKFYPYTEPSIGAQVDCGCCKGKGCSSCGQSGWITVAGAGMIHRNVLAEFKYDTDKVEGFAFGFGTGRLAAQLCDYDDIRKLYQNDLRIFM